VSFETVVTKTAAKRPAIKDVPRKKGAAANLLPDEEVINPRILRKSPMLPPILQIFYAIWSPSISRL
jgi:hypothetical protein